MCKNYHWLLKDLTSKWKQDIMLLSDRNKILGIAKQLHRDHRKITKLIENIDKIRTRKKICFKEI